MTLVTYLDSRYRTSRYYLSQDTRSCARRCKGGSRFGEELLMATSVRERERALAWIASQLRWERTLAGLRGETAGDVVERQAA